ncbi:Hypothetical_protein [Hexamita inflata]|uniref:Hypothetical_protein n=1 Tax=Hexamita inflata TaxID=28002 RepID=A0AA86NK56_9EUKA|nr:Hypothetical protein HINF_LOCUS9207 [Hexamita inflata]
MEFHGRLLKHNYQQMSPLQLAQLYEQQSLDQQSQINNLQIITHLFNPQIQKIYKILIKITSIIQEQNLQTTNKEDKLKQKNLTYISAVLFRKQTDVIITTGMPFRFANNAIKCMHADFVMMMKQSITNQIQNKSQICSASFVTKQDQLEPTAQNVRNKLARNVAKYVMFQVNFPSPLHRFTIVMNVECVLVVLKIIRNIVINAIIVTTFAIKKIMSVLLPAFVQFFPILYFLNII